MNENVNAITIISKLAKNRTVYRFMYNEKSELRLKYKSVAFFFLLKSTNKDPQIQFVKRWDFSFSKTLSLREIVERITSGTQPTTQREIDAAKRHKRKFNLSLIHRVQNFILPAYNEKMALRDDNNPRYELQKVLCFMDSDLPSLGRLDAKYANLYKK